ncbi:MAG: LamG-like jellyroll fold domain-containing protein [Planctomycetota bacterium]
MSESFENLRESNELSELIDALISGEISDDQFDELSQRLKNDPEALRRYTAEMRIEHGLQELASANQEPVVFPRVDSNSQSRGTSAFLSSIWVPWIIIGIMALGLVGLWLTPNGNLDNAVSGAAADPDDDSANADVEVLNRETLLSSFVARLTNGQEMTWNTDDQLVVGSWLKPGQYGLNSGAVEITFDAGAVVYLAGSSVFDIVNPNEIRLVCGSLEASIPDQAVGFRVSTPSGAITDLSTEFGVKVSENGESDIHVLKGLVEARPVAPADSEYVTIKERSAIRLFPDAPPEPVEFSDRRLVEFGSRNNPDQLSYVHFSFDEPEVEDGVIANHGPGGRGEGGRVVDGSAPNSWVQVDGQFDKSLFFSGSGARVETDIKGIDGIEPRTIMFWVRISPDAPFHSAYSFIAWGRTGRADGHKWQIGWNPNYERDTEGAFGAVRTEFGGGYVIGSTDLRDGRWHHVASVFVGGTGEENVAGLIRHYVDGKLESVSGAKDKRIMTESSKKTLTIGEYIGMGEDVFTGYKGWIDEFYVFDGALTPEQIVQVMETNQPPASREIVVRTDADH